MRRLLHDICREMPATPNGRDNRSFEIDATGRSGARVLLFDDCVLKTEKSCEHAHRERDVLFALDDIPFAPSVISCTEEHGSQQLLMERLPGRPACSPDVLGDPDLLAEAVRNAVLALAETAPPADLPSLPSPADVAASITDVATRSRLLERIPDPDPGFVHGDLCLPNIIVSDSGDVSLVDWGDAGFGDRKQNLAALYWSLTRNVDGTYGSKYPDVDPDRIFMAAGIRADKFEMSWYRAAYSMS